MGCSATMSMAVGIAFLALAAGCGGGASSDPFGPEPDFGAIGARMAAPSGTFAEGHEAKVLDGYAAKRAASRSAPPIGGAAASASFAGMASESLSLLDLSPSKTTCPALAHRDEAGSCKCPGGGAFTFDFSGAQALHGKSAFDVTLKIELAHCNDGKVTLDGREFLRMSRATENAPEMQMTLDAHLAVTEAGTPRAIDFDFAYQDAKWWTAVATDDGDVVVGGDAGWNDATKTGTVRVRDRRAVWTCTLTEGRGACTSDKGDRRTVL